MPVGVWVEQPELSRLSRAGMGVPSLLYVPVPWQGSPAWARCHVDAPRQLESGYVPRLVNPQRNSLLGVKKSQTEQDYTVPGTIRHSGTELKWQCDL